MQEYVDQLTFTVMYSLISVSLQNSSPPSAMKKWLYKAKQRKLLASQANFPKILMRQGGTFFFVVVIISVGSNAVAAYTGNNHACIQHKCFTDNDRDQQTYGANPEMTRNGHNLFSPM